MIDLIVILYHYAYLSISQCGSLHNSSNLLSIRLIAREDFYRSSNAILFLDFLA